MYFLIFLYSDADLCRPWRLKGDICCDPDSSGLLPLRPDLLLDVAVQLLQIHHEGTVCLVEPCCLMNSGSRQITVNLTPKLILLSTNLSGRSRISGSTSCSRVELDQTDDSCNQSGWPGNEPIGKILGKIDNKHSLSIKNTWLNIHFCSNWISKIVYLASFKVQYYPNEVI